MTSADLAMPPGLEGSGPEISPLEEILAPQASFIEALRDAILKEVEQSVQERTEALWAKGKQVLNQAQQKHREEVKELMDEVALCQQRHQLLAEENERLREALQSIISKYSMAPPETLLSPSSTAVTSPLPSDPDSSYPSRPFTPSPYTPAVDYYATEGLLPEVPPLPFSGVTGVPGAPAPLSLAEALGAPSQRTPVCLADSLNATAKTSPGSDAESAKHFTITINKTAEQEWGLDVSHEEDGKAGLRVDGLRPGGAVEVWNQQCLSSGQAEKALMPGDLITMCNGITEAARVLKECVSQQKLCLSILREGAGSASRAHQLRADASEFVPGGGQNERVRG